MESSGCLTLKLLLSGLGFVVAVESSANNVVEPLLFQTDYDMVDYLNELREGCLEAYTGIIQGLKGDQENVHRKTPTPPHHNHHHHLWWSDIGSSSCLQTNRRILRSRRLIWVFSPRKLQAAAWHLGGFLVLRDPTNRFWRGLFF